jgi:lipopolysaccharide export system permease protein
MQEQMRGQDNSMSINLPKNLAKLNAAAFETLGLPPIKIKSPPIFPSRQLAIMMARMFLVRTFATLAVLILVIQTLDMFGESGHVLAYPGNGSPALWHYVELRLPQLIDTFLPYTVLIGTLWTYITLNVNSEVIAMKSAGMSAHQILAPVIAASLGIALVSFAFNDRIVTRATDALERWSAAGYGPIPQEHIGVDNAWVLNGDNLVHADVVAGKGAGTVLHGVKIFVRKNGVLQSIITGEEARVQGQAWVMEKAQRFEIASGTATQLGQARVAEGVTPDRFTLPTLNSERVSLVPLSEDIQVLRAAGRQTTELQVGWWHKFSKPLSALLMPLLGSVAAFGLARSGRMNARLALGAVLGVLYFFVDNAAVSMGNIGSYPVFVAAWGPFFLFLLIGEAVLIRSEE